MGFRGLGNYGRILGPLPDVEAYELSISSALQVSEAS